MGDLSLCRFRFERRQWLCNEVDIPRDIVYQHEVVQWNGTIYDPSYGKTYTNQLQWEDSSVSVYLPEPTNDVKGVQETVWRPL